MEDDFVRREGTPCPSVDLDAVIPSVDLTEAFAFPSTFMLEQVLTGSKVILIGRIFSEYLSKDRYREQTSRTTE